MASLMNKTCLLLSIISYQRITEIDKDLLAVAEQCAVIDHKRANRKDTRLSLEELQRLEASNVYLSPGP